ncbi:PAS domain S-box protein [Bowmanella dokdonensis]|uniref:PAS domain S-box protein n=1 Tax=Bowmanella dokdonensis TaxID=751969 RepID=A0A939DL40_9ALTE|nr:PAS domain S-box protein [Bowmanella dokdonensis]MBN7824544.1 PAS domain S-box protein [Bowmanella dokdonensis]
MTRPVECKFGKMLTGLLLLLSSPSSYALGTALAGWSASSLNILFIAFGLALAGLVLSLLFLRLRLQRARQAEQQIQQQTEHRQWLLDGFNLGMVHLDGEGQVLYVNRVAAFMLGLKAEALTGKSFSSLLGESEQHRFEQALKQGLDCKIQFYSSKRQRALLLGVYPQKTPKQQIATILSLQDVTDYQQQLDQRQAELLHEQALAEASHLGRLTINLGDNSVTGSPALAEMLEIAVSELPDTLAEFEKRVHSEDWNKWRQVIEKAGVKQGLEAKCRIQSGEGLHHCRVFSLASELDDQGQPIRLDLTFYDATDLAQQRQQTETTRQVVKGLISGCPDPVYLLDEEGKLQEANRAFESLFKVSLLQLRGKVLTEMEFFPEELSALHQSGGSLSGLAAPSGKEIQLKLADNHQPWVKVRIQAVKDAQGKRTGLVGILEDNTVLKLAQQERDKALARFEQMLTLAPMAVALIDREDKIVQANQALQQRLGLDLRALQEGSFYQLFRDPDNSVKAAKQLHQSGQLRAFRAQLRGIGGEYHPCELHMDLFDRTEQTYLCWIHDTSEKQFQEDKFDSLLEHSSMPMAVMGEKGFTRLNPAACEFFAIEEAQELYGYFPYSQALNSDAQAADKLKIRLEQLKMDGRALSLVWQHQKGEEPLPCQATYVPMYKGQELESILCIWMDMRAIKRADEARQEAINQRRAAEKEAAEKQQLLESSQDQLASKVKSLADAQTQLEAAQEDLSEQKNKMSDLQQAHHNVTEHLNKLQKEYSDSRDLLSRAQNSNAELAAQLEQSSVKVNALERQRNQIADALQNSEKQYQRSQQQLAQSEQTSQRLKEEQAQQEQKMAEFVSQIDGLKQSMLEKDQQIQNVSGQINTLQSQLASSSQTGESLRQQLINQRKASEQAEQQRRELEKACREAQLALSSKARHVEHLQHEMQKFEEMSSQEKGDMEQQHQQLLRELEEKQAQLQQTQQVLNETKQQVERDKAEKAQQQQRLQQLQQEMEEVERRTSEQQQKVAQADRYWQAQQQKLQQELEAKQQQLMETQQVLQDAKQQTEAEKAEKARQQAIFAKLQEELAEMEERAAKQQQQIAERDQSWQEQQQLLKQELDAKQKQLQQAQQKLDENQRLSEAEKLQHLEQQQKLEQLKTELTDVESRAARQKEMMQGSDEQWRQHHEEIEAQKIQLQKALEDAQSQNARMQEKLAGSMAELQKAESQVSQTQSGEQKLLAELEQARQQAEALQQRLRQQEEQEASLQQQLVKQQQALLSREKNIQSLQDEQKQLTEQLHAVQDEYTNTKQSLSDQGSSQTALNDQLRQLEQELKDSKAQLDSKENALEEAQKKLQSSQNKLAEQEKALVAAHREELEQAKQVQKEDTGELAVKPVPEIARQPMPDNPEVWFDLLPYLQKNPQAGSLMTALNSLMEELQEATEKTDEAIKAENIGQVLRQAQKLVTLANRINSEPLIDLTSRLEVACRQGHMDSLSIFWPNVKRSLSMAMRVIYSHLQG